MPENAFTSEVTAVRSDTSVEAGGATAANATPKQIQAQFDLAISIILSNWPALTLAVQNQWGGPDSADKRDWLAGVISDLFANNPNTDAADVEDLILQVLQDEFEVDLEDESERLVAGSIVRLRQETARGDFSTVNALHAEWVKREEGKEGSAGRLRVVEQERDDDDDEFSDNSDEDSEDEGTKGSYTEKVLEDVEMGEAPGHLSSKPKPEVDEDGFTKVVGKKWR